MTDEAAEAAVLLIADFAVAAGLIGMAVFAIHACVWAWREVRKAL